MLLIHTLAMSTIIIAMLMILLSLALSKKNSQHADKNSQFECGFNPLSSLRISFSIQFFLITVIFLIFDVEVALLLPSILSIHKVKPVSWIILMSLFTLILIIGIFYEWNDGALEWK
uniref:NADH-ubiquinone oxidoreductase chain 3 n=1 Tax=Cymothoa indica TaxID=439382 RepID=A0A344AYW7_9CRUS|nr:NADH dehydrogenase subunit 3 [Cymothoa indica]